MFSCPNCFGVQLAVIGKESKVWCGTCGQDIPVPASIRNVPVPAPGLDDRTVERILAKGNIGSEAATTFPKRTETHPANNSNWLVIAAVVAVVAVLVVIALTVR